MNNIKKINKPIRLHFQIWRWVKIYNVKYTSKLVWIFKNKKKLYESSKLASILDVYTISEIRKNNNLIRSGDLKKTWKLPNAEERWKMLKLH